MAGANFWTVSGRVAVAMARIFLGRGWAKLGLLQPKIHYRWGHWSLSGFSALFLPSRVGRLGNGLIQVGAILSYARFFGRTAVVLNSQFPLFAEGYYQVDGTEIHVIDKNKEPKSTDLGRNLRGPLLEADWFYSYPLLQRDRRDISEGLRMARPLLKDEYRDDVFATEDLVVHYRVGDILGRSPHAGYGAHPPTLFSNWSPEGCNHRESG